MKRFLLALPLLFSTTSGALTLEQHPQVSRVNSCFSGMTASFERWVSTMEKRKPGFDRSRFPFTQAQFDAYKDTLDCETFVYQVDGIAITGWQVSPKQASQDKPLPAVIYNRGGNGRYGQWVFGSVMHSLMPLAEAGYAVIATNLRPDPRDMKHYVANGDYDEFGGAEHQDVLALWSIVQSWSGVDADRTGTVGSSRGAMQSFMLARDVPSLKTLVSISGATDISAIAKARPKFKKMLQRRIPDFEQSPNTALNKRSAVTWVDQLPKPLPVLLIHAKDDDRVPFDTAVAMTQALTAHGQPHQLMAFEDGGHNLGKHRDDAQQAILAWLAEYL
ncbi:prolyl oligopeptidase family serine peptidase [Aestuariibacter halophilus]|uniref:Prolyl oligopeptidase family serine peptidase n=1 Tax=Fluctibacter halophilus TaxID=226011 RepID=A0ABS8G6P7_9ALTE|nr:prolyl oligopeptidase family serine peptidase [Aestuariibacter halophilus]MCC2616210.1 prolyl oligopeptidase family serine peptidase [Aestuariibacter halophilus]